MESLYGITNLPHKRNWAKKKINLTFKKYIYFLKTKIKILEGGDDSHQPPSNVFRQSR